MSQLVSVPGGWLHVYEDFSAKLLEQNVRTYLQARGNNKGIPNTMRRPSMFFAYNNGLTPAENVQIALERWHSVYKKLSNFQIVNGK